jgi:hypothetical protein
MIFISITPFSPQRLLLFFVATVCLSCVSCFAQPTFFAVKSTPYDNQMGRVRSILRHEKVVEDSRLSLNVVNHWIGNLRAIPYAFSQQWKTPAEVERATTADCKGKAVALYEKMQSSGATNFRLVIGKRTASSRSTHTWLEWSTSGGKYVLDPTINWIAYKADQISKDTYQPLYAYSGRYKVSVTTSALLAKN